MKLNLRITGILIIVVCAIGLVTFFNRVRSSGSELVQAVKRDQNPIRIEKIKVVDLTETMKKSGALDAKNDVIITSEVAGKVRKIVRDLGDVCKKNEVLVQLDPENYRIALLDADAGLRASIIDLDQRQRDLKRSARLAQRSAISAQNLEQAQTSVSVTDALVKRSDAAAQLARRNLRETNIRCPFTGVVATKMVSMGQFVSPQTPLARLVDNSQLTLSLSVSAEELARLRTGQKVAITTTFLQDETLFGSVERLGIAADRITRTFPVEVLISGESGLLKSGQIVQAMIRIAEHKGIVAVPVDAVLQDEKGKYLFLAEGGKARRVEVQTGPQVDDRIIIAEGVKPMQEVIVVGHHGLKHGDSVEKIGDETAATRKTQTLKEQSASPAPTTP